MTISQLPPPQSQRLVTPYRVIVLVLLALATGLVVFAAQSHPNPPPVFHDSVVRVVSPAPGSLGLRQSEIFIEIDPTYDGLIEQVNQTRIPEDQLKRIPNLLRITYDPGQPDSATGRLPAGRNCVLYRYWRIGSDPAQGTERSWCFNLH
ncbi:MAG TPA: hypothetical protein VKI20_04715 [Acidimicrobiales bacterium]|nr:hypothetical protein [Acidimicrobiales bacterium]